jgi:hypothetical protein
MANAITRIFKLQSGGTMQDVPVRLFWPISDDKAWDCRWEIDWPDGPRTNSGRGVDAIQALINAMTMIGAEIYSSEAHKAGVLSWSDDWRGYGFPVTANLRDMLAGDDRRFL